MKAHDSPSLIRWHSFSLLIFLLLSSLSITSSGANTDDFIRQAEDRLGVSLPSDTTIEHAETYVGIEPFDTKTKLTHEWFAVITMSPTNAQIFKKMVISKERDPKIYRLNWRDQDNNQQIGFSVIPGPIVIPESIRPWWRVKVEPIPIKGSPITTTIILWKTSILNENEGLLLGGATILISEKTGKIWIWTYEIPTK